MVECVLEKANILKNTDIALGLYHASKKMKNSQI